MDVLLKYKRWIYAICLIVNLLLGIIISLIPEGGDSLAAWAFLAIFSAVCEMFVIQLIAVILGFIFRKRKTPSLMLVAINILVLLATIIRYFF